MTVLYAGPWCGELGFELMCWQAHVRNRAKAQYDKVIVGCTKNSWPIYEDFADSFWEVPLEMNTSGKQWCNGGHKRIEEKFGEMIPHNGEWMRAQLVKCHSGFIHYGRRRPGFVYDVVLHARHMQKGKGDMDWRRSAPEDWWDELGVKLSKLGYSTVSIGLKEVSLHVAGSGELRGVPMGMTMDVLRSSVLAIGPSSGPTHLAALCGCPQVVWTDTGHRSGYDARTNVDKLKNHWNPFKVDVAILHAAGEWWAPDHDLILEEIEKLHEKHRNPPAADGGRDPVGTQPVQ